MASLGSTAMQGSASTHDSAAEPRLDALGRHYDAVIRAYAGSRDELQRNSLRVLGWPSVHVERR